MALDKSRNQNPPATEGAPGSIQDHERQESQGSSVVSVSMSWDPPVPLNGPTLPVFPVGALPVPVRDYVQAVAESVQVPIDLPAMMALAIGATTTARRFEVHVQGDHVEPTNLWTVCILPSGSRKSACFRHMSQVLMNYEQREPMRLIGGDDASPEAVARLLSENGNRIATLSPEGGVFDFMEGRREGGAGLDVYVKAHAGDDHYVDRITRDGFRLVRPALTMGLTVQPEIMSGIMARRAFRGRGVVARMLFAIPASLVGRRRIRSKPIPEAVAASYAKAVEAALAAGNSNEVARLHLSDGALAAWSTFAERIELRQAEAENLAHIADWASKLAGAVIRIAGVMHVLSGASGHKIALRTMRNAVRIGHYLIPHALHVFGQMGADVDLARAKLLVNWFKSERLREFTRRDAMRRFQIQFPKAYDLTGPLQALIEHGYIRPVRSDDNAHPGRPTEKYEINPQTL